MIQVRIELNSGETYEQLIPGKKVYNPGFGNSRPDNSGGPGGSDQNTNPSSSSPSAPNNSQTTSDQDTR